VVTTVVYSWELYPEVEIQTGKGTAAA